METEYTAVKKEVELVAFKTQFVSTGGTGSKTSKSGKRIITD